VQIFLKNFPGEAMAAKISEQLPI